MNTTGIIILSLLGIIIVYLIIKMTMDSIWNYRLKKFQENNHITHPAKPLRLSNLRKAMLVVSTSLIMMVVVATEVFSLPEFITDIETGKQKELVVASKANSYQKLRQKLNEGDGFNHSNFFPFFGFFSVTSEAGDMVEPTEEDTSAPPDVVGTNLQVAGVDEADIVKTDGYEILYTPSYHKNKIYRFDVNVDGTLLVKDSLEFADFVVDSFYLTDDYIVVVGYTFEEVNVYYDIALDALIMPYNWYYYRYTGSVRIYDRVSLNLEYELATDGNIQEHRLINHMFYMISYTQVTADEVRPRFEETIDNVTETSYVDYDDIFIFENIPAHQMMVVTAINIEEKNYNAQAVVGVSSVMYVTNDAIYTAGTFYYYPLMSTPIYGTHIIKFKLNHETGLVSYAASTVVEGFVENQFYMDAYQGNLRVVTSRSWGSDRNRLYVLKENEETDQFDVIGLLDRGLGKPLERVTSVRFNGNEAFVVTFRNTDPLYTIDLTDPTNPVITNEIEEPGYNTYLHVWGEDKVVGVGYDQFSGVKISVYDTSDTVAPLDTVSISDTSNETHKWNWSEALNNHKAILVSPEHGFIGFAVNMYSYIGGNYQYGSYFYIFNIDFESEEIISEPIIISHGFTGYQNIIDRGIYINGIFYTFSSNSVVSYNTFEQAVLENFLLEE